MAGCKVDLFDLHHVSEQSDICQSVYLHTHIPPYVFSYVHLCVCGLTCVSVCVRAHFQFPGLCLSQPMQTLILHDLVGLDQKLPTKGKEQSA